jgi:hypothetical protein
MVLLNCRQIGGNFCFLNTDKIFMPYIYKEERSLYNDSIEQLVNSLVDKFPGENGKDFSEGDLNYIISSIVWKLFDKSPSYRLANKLTGVIQCVQSEFYRRKVIPYEDHKIIENGDIQ